MKIDDRMSQISHEPAISSEAIPSHILRHLGLQKPNNLKGNSLPCHLYPVSITYTQAEGIALEQVLRFPGAQQVLVHMLRIVVVQLA